MALGCKGAGDRRRRRRGAVRAMQGPCKATVSQSSVSKGW
jgi:hypothetical protein